MARWTDIIVTPDRSIRSTVEVINTGNAQAAIVCEADRTLLGIITDGDIRRAILAGIDLDGPVGCLVKSECTSVNPDISKSDVYNAMRQLGLRHMPVVDKNNKLLDFFHITDFFNTRKFNNPVVIMAGGLGTRLHPLTEDTPKPMLHVGPKPMLQTILENFIHEGFHNFYFSINFKAELIKEYFGDGTRWNVSISYLEEDKRLGTAGALSLFSVPPEKPVIVINGDVLTQVDFTRLMEFHTALNSPATVCVREYDYQIPYGVIEVDGYVIDKLEEKPTHKCFINTGIYVLNPECLSYIPEDTMYDMTDLLRTLLEQDKIIGSFPVREYWLDVGRHADYERANHEFSKTFEETKIYTAKDSGDHSKLLKPGETDSDSGESRAESAGSADLITTQEEQK